MRDGLVFKAHIPLYHSTLGWRVIKKKKKLCFNPSGERLITAGGDSKYVWAQGFTFGGYGGRWMVEG